jgi:hypothetical protein
MRQLNHVAVGLAPVADAFAGTVYSDIFNMKEWENVQFLVSRGAAAGAGTAVLTVEACSDVAATAVTAIPFTYQLNTSGDTYGAHTEVAASGVTFPAGANLVAKIDVDASDLGATGYNYVRLKSVEGTDAAYVGSILAIFTEGKSEQDIPATVLT